MVEQILSDVIDFRRPCTRNMTWGRLGSKTLLTCAGSIRERYAKSDVETRVGIQGWSGTRSGRVGSGRLSPHASASDRAAFLKFRLTNLKLAVIQLQRDQLNIAPVKNASPSPTPTHLLQQRVSQASGDAALGSGRAALAASSDHVCMRSCSSTRLSVQWTRHVCQLASPF